MLHVTLATLALAMSPAPPRAEPAKSAPTPGFEGRAGDLHVIQLWSDDNERFLREWALPTPPNLTTTSRVERNKPIFLFVIFDSCRADAQGNCNLTGSIEVLDPDGASYGSFSDVKFWDNQPAPEPKLLVLSPGALGLTIEDGEKLGQYTVRVVVTDVNANVTARTEDVITVVEAGTK